MSEKIQECRDWKKFSFKQRNQCFTSLITQKWLFQSQVLVTCQPRQHSSITLINQQPMIKLEFTSNSKRCDWDFVVFLLLNFSASLWGIWILIKLQNYLSFFDQTTIHPKHIFGKGLFACSFGLQLGEPMIMHGEIDLIVNFYLPQLLR